MNIYTEGPAGCQPQITKELELFPGGGCRGTIRNERGYDLISRTKKPGPDYPFVQITIWLHGQVVWWIFPRRNAINSKSTLSMATCIATGCKIDVPGALTEQKLCVLHFTLSVEGACAEMRRETVLGNAPHDRQAEIVRYISENGGALARVATSGLHLADEMKARVLSTFLTLMNLRENLDRSSLRHPPGRTGAVR